MRFVLLLAASFFFTCSVAMLAADVQNGAKLYKTKCATCHGPKGEGNPKIAKMLKVELRHLGSKEVQSKSDNELKKDIVQGVGKMQPIKGLTDQQVADIIAFVRTLKQ